MKQAGSLWRLALVALTLIYLGAAGLVAAGAASLAAPATLLVCPRMMASVHIDGRADEWSGIPLR